MRTRRLAHAAVAAVLAAGAVTSAPLASPSSAASARAQHTASATTVRVHRAAQLRKISQGRSATLAAITKAVRTSEFTDGVPASWYTVRDLRIAGSWARVTLRPTPGADIDPATVVLRRSGTTWRVMDLGTAEVGCGVAPAATLERLALTCD